MRFPQWVLILAACTAAYPAQLSLPAVTASPGSSVSLPLTFTSQSASVAGVQFDLQFDSINLSVNVILGNSARAAGKSLNLWQVAPGLWRFIIFGLNQTPLADGPLVNFLVNVNPAASSTSYPVQLLNIVASDPSANAIQTTATGGSIVLQTHSAPPAARQTWRVVNGASLETGGVAAGEVVTLFGASLGSATVLFDQIPAPILHAGVDQINLVVPFEVQRPLTQLQIIQSGQTIAQLRIPVVDASPGIFAADGSGAGPGAILNLDYSLNSASNPAAKGTAITIYATGAGQTDPPGVDGQVTGTSAPQLLLPVTVQIGGMPAQVLYAGAAPGLVSGIFQVNCVIPAGAPSGLTIPVVLTVGTVNSQPGLIMAVQ